MNELLKRRLAGLMLIILLTFVVSLLLPQPGELPLTDRNIQRVTLELKASSVQPSQFAPVATPLPPVIEASPPAKPQPAQISMVDTEPDLEVPPASHDDRASVVSQTAPVSKLPSPSASKPAVSVKKNAVTAAPKSASSASKWYVQLGAFSEVQNARQLLLKFRAQKYPGILSPAETPKGVRYRVWIGPFASRDQAFEAQKRMIKAGAAGTKLVED